MATPVKIDGDPTWGRNPQVGNRCFTGNYVVSDRYNFYVLLVFWACFVAWAFVLKHTRCSFVRVGVASSLKEEEVIYTTCT